MNVKELYKERKLYESTYKFFKEKYENREDKENLYGVGITEDEFVEIIMREFLGEDWYVVDPLGHTQVLECALCDILSKYSPKFNDKGDPTLSDKEIKRMERKLKKTNKKLARLEKIRTFIDKLINKLNK